MPRRSSTRPTPTSCSGYQRPRRGTRSPAAHRRLAKLHHPDRLIDATPERTRERATAASASSTSPTSSSAAERADSPRAVGVARSTETGVGPRSPVRPVCVSDASTARRSTRSFIGSPLWPFTHRNVTSPRATTSSTSGSHRSRLATGLRWLFVQPALLPAARTTCRGSSSRRRSSRSRPRSDPAKRPAWSPLRARP